MIRRFFFLLIIFIISAGIAAADNGYISYIEGRVSIQKPGAGQRFADIGDAVATGDTIYTAADSLAEISLDSGSTVTIDASSAFNVSESIDPESESRKKSFFRVLMGAVSFKFRNLSNEPDVGTPLTVCSVRGTDFTVYTGPDGASLTVVSDGLVEVSSGGSMALLSAGEGVEAQVGLGLGEPFEVKTGFIRYDQFVDEALARIDEDPAGALEGLTNILSGYISDGEFYLKSHDENMDLILSIREKVKNARESKGEEAAKLILVNEYGPVQERGFDLSTTYRYYLYSALMMRRYTFSSLYIQARTAYLTNIDNHIWIDFNNMYQDFLALYETQLIPILEEEDL